MKPLHLLPLLIALAGCSYSPSFEVGYEVERSTAVVSTRTVAVLPFLDEREEKKKGHWLGKALLLYLPVVPYATYRHSRVDELAADVSQAGGKVVDIVWIGPVRVPIKKELPKIPSHERILFRNAFPAAIAQDLRLSGVCQARFRPDAEAVAPQTDYVLTGTLDHTEYRVSFTTFGLGLAGYFLWPLPLPMLKVTGVVELVLRLKDRKTQQVVFEARARGEESGYRTAYGLWYMPYDKGLRGLGLTIYRGNDDEYLASNSLFWWHFMALRKAMQGFKPRLARFLRQRDGAQATPASSR